MKPILVADRRIFETVDGRIVDEDHADAHRLVAACPGDEIDPLIRRRLGLELDKEGRVCQAGDEEDDAPPTQTRSAGMTKAQIIEALEELGQDVKKSALKADLAAQLDAIDASDPSAD